MFHTALSVSGIEVPEEEAECLVANMIYKGFMRGYLSHEKQMVVLSSVSAFPRLADRPSPLAMLWSGFKIYCIFISSVSLIRNLDLNHRWPTNFSWDLRYTYGIHSTRWGVDTRQTFKWKQFLNAEVTIDSNHQNPPSQYEKREVYLSFRFSLFGTRTLSSVGLWRSISGLDWGCRSSRYGGLRLCCNRRIWRRFMQETDEYRCNGSRSKDKQPTRN